VSEVTPPAWEGAAAQEALLEEVWRDNGRGGVGLSSETIRNLKK